MIEPHKSGEALLREIEETRSDDRSLFVWWLGQSGYVLKHGDTIVVVDPYLSEHLTHKYEGTSKPHVRMTRSPFRGADFALAHLVLSSHKHSDHMDPGTLPDLLAASTHAEFFFPAALADHVVSMGLPIDRSVGMVAGSVETRGPVAIRALPSAHEGLDTDHAGRHLYLGFVIQLGPFRVYHSGDSLAYDGLARALGAEPFDVMLLPINGRDPKRGVAGNMSAAEADDLANLVRPRFLVPHHYDMFTFNTVPVESFEKESARLRDGVGAKVLCCGERWEVGR